MVEPVAGFPYVLDAKGALAPSPPPAQGAPPTSFSAATAAACAPSSRALLESALSSVQAAVGMVCAGTGDVATIGALRELRRGLHVGINYGSWQANSMAMGLVGLASGRATLSRSNGSIAALFIAFLPYWPHGSASNSYYPQALRNLYALAVHTRSVEAFLLSDGRSGARDDDDPEALDVSPVHCGLQVTLKAVTLVSPPAHQPQLPPSRTLHPRVLYLATPCLLPELHCIASIAVLPAPSALPSPLRPYTLHCGSVAAHAAALLPVGRGGRALRGAREGARAPEAAAREHPRVAAVAAQLPAARAALSAAARLSSPQPASAVDTTPLFVAQAEESSGGGGRQEGRAKRARRDEGPEDSGGRFAAASPAAAAAGAAAAEAVWAADLSFEDDVLFEGDQAAAAAAAAPAPEAPAAASAAGQHPAPDGSVPSYAIDLAGDAQALGVRSHEPVVLFVSLDKARIPVQPPPRPRA